jgi:hypothetical protein
MGGPYPQEAWHGIRFPKEEALNTFSGETETGWPPGGVSERQRLCLDKRHVVQFGFAKAGNGCSYGLVEQLKAEFKERRSSREGD